MWMKAAQLIFFKVLFNTSLLPFSVQIYYALWWVCSRIQSSQRRNTVYWLDLDKAPFGHGDLWMTLGSGIDMARQILPDGWEKNGKLPPYWHELPGGKAENQMWKLNRISIIYVGDFLTVVWGVSLIISKTIPLLLSIVCEVEEMAFYLMTILPFCPASTTVVKGTWEILPMAVSFLAQYELFHRKTLSRNSYFKCSAGHTLCICPLGLCTCQLWFWVGMSVTRFIMIRFWSPKHTLHFTAWYFCLKWVPIDFSSHPPAIESN